MSALVPEKLPEAAPAAAVADAVLTAFTRPRRRASTDEELAALASATRTRIGHRGLSLAAWRWGEGPPVLLLHGWESRSSHMAAFVPGLLAAGFGVVALDSPAHGESEGEETHVMDHGAAVEAAANALGPLAGVIAHSVGSAAALHAYAHGVRVPASVQLCGPSSLVRMVRGAGRAAGLAPADVVRLEARLAQRLGAPLEAMDLGRLKAGLVHPALILHDPQDREVPLSESTALAAAWPAARLATVEGVGHRRILRDPAVVERAVAFLAGAR